MYQSLIPVNAGYFSETSEMLQYTWDISACCRNTVFVIQKSEMFTNIFISYI